MRPVNREKFFDGWRDAFGPLTQGQVDGIESLLANLEADDRVNDIRWAAYMLATTYYETAKTMQPIEEYGRGKGRRYGLPVGPYNLIYYGRGLTQNTWLTNYDMLTKAWNKAHPDEQIDFVKNPELLLVMKYSYWAMSYSMRNGTYTGVGLRKYINSEKTDYINARKIINGLDAAERVAGYAEKIENILRSSCLDA